MLRDVCVIPRDKNSFVVTDDRENKRETPAPKLTIGNVPVHFSNQEIMDATRSLGIKIRWRLIEEWNRDSSGKLSRWKTGRRFLCTDVPAKPVPRNLRIGFLPPACILKSGESVRAATACQKDTNQASLRHRPSADSFSPTLTKLEIRCSC